VGVSRQTVHSWLARYEAGGLEGLSDRSHRPVSCPHQMGPAVEARVLELRRVHRSWGARRIVFELARLGGGSGAVGVGGATQGSGKVVI
jgi:transposase